MGADGIRGIMDTTLEKLKNMVKADTVIGDPIEASDTLMIIPVSKVSYGLASGGSDISSKTPMFGGGGGAGVSVKPVAFLVINKLRDEVRVIPVEAETSNVEKAITAIPDVVDKIKEMVSEKKEKELEDKD